MPCSNISKAQIRKAVSQLRAPVVFFSHVYTLTHFFSPSLNLAVLTGVQGHSLPSVSPAVIDKFREHSKSLKVLFEHF